VFLGIEPGSPVLWFAASFFGDTAGLHLVSTYFKEAFKMYW
jgi:hypothetical protein